MVMVGVQTPVTVDVTQRVISICVPTSLPAIAEASQFMPPVHIGYMIHVLISQKPALRITTGFGFALF